MEDSTTTAAAAAAALPYQDPPIKTLLILSSFLILLSAINHILDRLIYCGLVGQVLIGVAFGTPGLQWLDKGTEQVIVQLGYLGLILLVYEGGLNTNFKSLKTNAILSTSVALVGICLPIAFAFSLQSLASATPLQAFAAGAALCSTSLGTAFSILSSSCLTNTRLGTVLTSAAMMDDVIGLVLVQVISRLGSSSSSLHAITVVRPIAVSIGLALAIVLACLYLVKPFSLWVRAPGSSAVMRAIRKQPDEAALIVHILLLFGLVATASYAGTSNLFAAYLAGASISWYCSELAPLGDVVKGDGTEVTQSVATTLEQQGTYVDGAVARIEDRNTSNDITDRGAQQETPAVASAQATNGSVARLCKAKHTEDSLREISIYKKYIEQSVARLLKPFFFASLNKTG